MSSSDSITAWVHQVQEGDHEAARRLWERCFPEVLRMARARAKRLPGRVAGEESLAVGALESFLLAAEQGHFPDLASRDDLWRLLATILHRKAASSVRRAMSQKRGEGRVRGESALGDSSSNALDKVALERLSPELEVAMAEECRRLLDVLDDDQLREIVVARLEGYSNREIAERLEVAPRTVERRLHLVRSCWNRELDR